MIDNSTSLKICSEFEVFETVNNLSNQEKELIRLSEEASENAYAPYSDFFVGAAALLENGTIVTGNNQENAAYPSGICAERVALFYAASQYKNVKINTLVITTKIGDPLNELPLTPCGACRQVIAEYESNQARPIRILMYKKNGKVYACNGISHLLPLMFNAKQLK